MGNFYDSKESVIRAANMYILRKVMDTMLKENAKYYKEVFGVSRSTLDNICGNTRDAGVEIDWGKIASKIGMDPEVFYGNRLILINGETINYINKIFDVEISNSNVSKEIKDFLLMQKLEKASEYSLWEVILNNKKYESNDIWHNAKRHILNEVGKQTAEQRFEDVQLWLFWNYLRKNYNVE